MKHPLKQFDEKKLDSLVEAARYEVHDKFAEEKAKALADKAVRDKYDATAPKYNPSFNDSTLVGPDARPAVMPTPVSKPSFKDKVKNFMKMFAKGAGYNPEHLKDL